MKQLTYLLLALLVAACSSIDCPVQNTVYTVYNFYSSDGEAISLLDTLTVTSARSDGTDTVLLNQGTQIATMSLPISYAHPEDVLLLHFKGSDYETTDTVWVKKDDIPHFESVDCSAAFFHKITQVRCTHALIDSIVVNNPDVTYDATTEHFHVYFKTGD